MSEMNTPTCTCPSGDGSLRWPCPAHPPELPPLPEPTGDYVVPFYTADQMHDYARAALAAQGEPMSEQQERADFEAWIAKDCGDLTMFGNPPHRHYRNSAVNQSWVAWQARAALEQLRCGSAQESQLRCSQGVPVGEVVEMDDGCRVVVWRDGTPEPGTKLFAASPAPAQAQQVAQATDGSPAQFRNSEDPRCKDGAAACIDCLMSGECIATPNAPPQAQQAAQGVPADLLAAIEAVGSAFTKANMKAIPPQEFAMDLLADAIGRLRNAATAQATPAQAQQAAPLTPEKVQAVLHEAGYTLRGASTMEKAAFINGLRHGERAHGIVGASSKESKPCA
jgi:hypothetical protein